MAHLSERVLTLLQFTRAALVLTAVADTLAAVLLRSGARGWSGVDAVMLALAVGVSAALYGFGMALNDLVDRHRDATLAAGRPIPSGRLGVKTAHVVVAVLGFMVLGLGGGLAWWTQSGATGWLVLGTLALINFYNFAGKYLVSLGLLALGLIRGVHACIAAPDVPVVWHGLWLMTHIVIVSAVAYGLEEKRPRFSPLHAAVVAAGVVLINVAAVAGVLSARWEPADGLRAIPGVLGLGWGMVWPLAATAVFAVWAGVVLRGGSDEGGRRARRREAGQRLMLAGLLWLIAYDAAFVAGFVGLWEAAGVLLLMPLAYGAVVLMRWWGMLGGARRRIDFREAQ
jgi:hypothetical protein